MFQASQGRTTVIVAHRLSTIQAADKIVVMSGGKLVEEGTHTQLMSHKGHYFSLVTAQVGSHNGHKHGTGKFRNT
ncbi:hypothetical protein PR048_019860 [Dryococelus australis]|uniref:p-glycoprotein n=1 Tax=Dryococelus australis TaxID=614101 RepID=A0ABQ9H4N5_9NEOP|nr:hypothetical protein PR048_019860 [Dryococelus australis]